MTLPTDPAVLVVVCRERSGWSGYDRGIRDHMADARRHPSDVHAFTYWSYQALTLAHLHLLGERWGSGDAFIAARSLALASLDGYGMPKLLTELAATVARDAERVDEDAPQCSGIVYPVNPDHPEEGHDVHHTAPCAVHVDSEEIELRTGGTRLSRHAVPHDFEVQPVGCPGEAQDPATCGTCGLTWDDAVITSMTPAPSARCPFEPFHVTASCGLDGEQLTSEHGTWVHDNGHPCHHVEEDGPVCPAPRTTTGGVVNAELAAEAMEAAHQAARDRATRRPLVALWVQVEYRDDAAAKGRPFAVLTGPAADRLSLMGSYRTLGTAVEELRAEVMERAADVLGECAAGEGPWFCAVCGGQIVGGPETGWHHQHPDGAATDAEHAPVPRPGDREDDVQHEKQLREAHRAGEHVTSWAGCPECADVV